MKHRNTTHLHTLSVRVSVAEQPICCDNLFSRGLVCCVSATEPVHGSYLRMINYWKTKAQALAQKGHTTLYYHFSSALLLFYSQNKKMLINANVLSHHTALNPFLFISLAIRWNHRQLAVSMSLLNVIVKNSNEPLNHRSCSTVVFYTVV